MTAWFHPSFGRVYRPDALARDFTTKLARRIDSGLFPMASARRNQYEVVERSSYSLRFRSTSVLTGINVGLNDVKIEIDPKTREVQYDVSYWTWAKYVVSLSLGIGGFLALFLVVLPILGIHLGPEQSYPPPTALAYLIPMIVFWGVLWPWMLIAFHKRPAARCLQRIFDEINQSSDRATA